MYEYPYPKRARKKPCTSQPEKNADKNSNIADRENKVLTILEPSVRSSLDEGALRTFLPIHVDSVHDAARAIRGPCVRALLLSPNALRHADLPAIRGLMIASTGVMTVAVVTDHEPATVQGLLDLGASGVRTTVDLTGREGWNQLRTLLAESVNETTVSILDSLMRTLEEASSGSRDFFETLIRSAPRVKTVRGFSQLLRVGGSTLMSRFFRAGLPSPKRYLVEMRLIYALALLEKSGVSIADVAYRLDYSSPQSFGRTIRSVKGISGTAFRMSSFQQGLEEYSNDLIMPYRRVLTSFDPLVAPVHSGSKTASL